MQNGRRERTVEEFENRKEGLEFICSLILFPFFVPDFVTRKNENECHRKSVVNSVHNFLIRAN